MTLKAFNGCPTKNALAQHFVSKSNLNVGHVNDPGKRFEETIGKFLRMREDFLRTCLATGKERKVYMSQKKKKAQPSTASKRKKKKFVRNKRIKVADWRKCLEASDVNKIWNELHRIVSSHPLVRASKKAGFLVDRDNQGVL